MTTMIRILYFAKLVDLLGRSSEDVDPPSAVADVAGLLAWLRERGPRWAGALRSDAVKVTVNKSFADPGTQVRDGDEVAIISAGI
jgi:molybdopterin synthase sulfur carrier subunit